MGGSLSVNIDDGVPHNITYLPRGLKAVHVLANESLQQATKNPVPSVLLRLYHEGRLGSVGYSATDVDYITGAYNALWDPADGNPIQYRQVLVRKAFWHGAQNAAHEHGSNVLM